MVSRKSKLVADFMAILGTSAAAVPTPVLASVLPETTPHEPIYIDPIPSLSLQESFSIHTSQNILPWTASVKDASELLQIFLEKFRDALPVLPRLFFARDPHAIYNDSKLLFWTVLVTALLATDRADDYRCLADHVRNMVVVTCWFNTPRSLYSLVALLVLTTWPLPESSGLKNPQNDISVKYISLMKSLALQLGLHKLDFLDEFSKKTNMELGPLKDLNVLMRERIYKYININSNYWLVYLGLSTSSYNGFHQDYIICKSAHVDVYADDIQNQEDRIINSLLKVSLIQSKMNESMNDSNENPNGRTGKLIHLNMFEKIMQHHQDARRLLVEDPLIALSIEFSKLQLYVYYFSLTDQSLLEYVHVVYRAIACCKRVLEIYEAKYGSETYFALVPIHYRFCIELSALVLTLVHSSPYLQAVSHYDQVRDQIRKTIALMTRGPDGALHNTKLLDVIYTFDHCDKRKLYTVLCRSNSFTLISKFASHLISGLTSELSWLAHQANEVTDDEISITWSKFGLFETNENHKQIVAYLMSGATP